MTWSQEFEDQIRLFAVCRDTLLPVDSTVPQVCLDALYTAMEGGISYWAAILAYEEKCGFARIIPLEWVSPGALARIYRTQKDLDEGISEIEYPTYRYIHIDSRTVARGLARLMDDLNQEEPEIFSPNFGEMIISAFESDRDEIDGGYSEQLIQIGLFGDTIYS